MSTSFDQHSAERSLLRPASRGQRLLFESEAEARFLAFNEANPHVFSALKRMSLALKAAGHKRWGLRCLWEHLRYELAIQTTESAPRLNNDYAPFFARKLMAEVPELAGFFETRSR